jgi:membrane protein YqaA with SNARE-associated domain
MSLRRIPVLKSVLKTARRLYDWMLSFADKPNAPKALFWLSFAESSFFPLPPDPLLMAMGAGAPQRAVRFAAITTVASVLGALVGYSIGAFLMDSVGTYLLDLYDADRHTWGKIETWYATYGVLALLLAAVTPIPFKVFTIASGAMGLGFLPFVGACALGRGARFFLEGFLLRYFGKPIVKVLDKWFDLAAIVFAVMLVGGFMLIKYI